MRRPTGALLFWEEPRGQKINLSPAHIVFFMPKKKLLSYVGKSVRVYKVIDYTGHSYLL